MLAFDIAMQRYCRQGRRLAGAGLERPEFMDRGAQLGQWKRPQPDAGGGKYCQRWPHAFHPDRTPWVALCVAQRLISGDQFFEQYHAAGVLDGLGKLPIVRRVLGLRKVNIEGDQTHLAAHQFFDQLAVNRARPLHRHTRQAQLVAGGAVDSDHGDVGWWLGGTTDFKQRRQSDTAFEQFAQWRGNDKNTEEPGKSSHRHTAQPIAHRKKSAAPSAVSMRSAAVSTLDRRDATACTSNIPVDETLCT